MKREDLELLREFSENNNDEYGEMLNLLVTLYDSYEPYYSERLLKALKKELEINVDWVKNKFEQVEETETFERKVTVWREKSQEKS